MSLIWRYLGMRTALLLALVLTMPTAAIADEQDLANASALEPELPLPEPSPAMVTPLEETVVFARRRAELLEDTPISLTVLTGETLRVTETTSLDQIQGLVPNLSIFRTGDGQSASIVIRGVGNFPVIYSDQGVGLYVDGVYLSRSIGSILELVDIAQIDVLRGPQGTLFGKNTVGGAINVTTVKPKPEFESIGMLRAGSYGTFDSRVTVNAPIRVGGLQDQLVTRLTFASFQNDGYDYNAFYKQYQSDQNSLNFLGTVQFAPRDDLVMSVTGTWTGNHTHAVGGRCIFVHPPVLGDFPDGYEEACNSSKPYRFEADTRRLASLDSYGTWGILNWTVPTPPALDRLAVKLTSSWREQIPRLRDDGDMTRFDVASRSGIGGDDPFDGQPGFQRQIQQEVQVDGLALDERLAFVAGFFAYWEEAHTQDGVIIFPGTPLQDLATSVRATAIDNWDWAPFAQVTGQILPHLSLTAGARYTEEKKGLSRLVTKPLAEDPSDRTVLDYDNSKIFSAWTPMASLAATVPEDWLAPYEMDRMMGYFSYARGFRGGGINGGAVSLAQIKPFDPEFVDSYEIGLKTIGFEHRAVFNISLFLAKRTDQQVSQVEGAGLLPVTITTNAASSTSKGFEADFEAQPLPGLLINGSAGYLDAVYDSFPNAVNADTGIGVDRSGQALPFVPRWQTYLGIQYAMPGPNVDQAWLRGTFVPRVDWSWQSEVVNWGPEVVDLVQPEYSLLGIRLAYDFNDSRSEIAFWGRNLADQEYFRDSLAQAFALGTVIRYYEQPRTFGVDISQRF